MDVINPTAISSPQQQLTEAFEFIELYGRDGLTSFVQASLIDKALEQPESIKVEVSYRSDSIGHPGKPPKPFHIILTDPISGKSTFLNAEEINPETMEHLTLIGSVVEARSIHREEQDIRIENLSRLGEILDSGNPLLDRDTLLNTSNTHHSQYKYLGNAAEYLDETLARLQGEIDGTNIAMEKFQCDDQSVMVESTIIRLINAQIKHQLGLPDSGNPDDPETTTRSACMDNLDSITRLALEIAEDIIPPRIQGEARNAIGAQIAYAAVTSLVTMDNSLAWFDDNDRTTIHETVTRISRVPPEKVDDPDYKTLPPEFAEVKASQVIQRGIGNPPGNGETPGASVLEGPEPNITLGKD